MKLYSLIGLSREVNVSPKTLRTWRRKGWLVPAGKVGTYERYTMTAFEEACKRTLESPSTIIDDYDTNWTRS